MLQFKEFPWVHGRKKMDTTQWILIFGGFFIVILVPLIIARRRRKE
jgi:hypothetical protein